MEKTCNKRVLIGSIRIDDLSWDEALETVADLIRRRSGGYVVTPNVDHVVLADSDPELREIYQRADAVFCDGTPLLWAARFLGTPLRAKVSGSDFLVRFSPLAARRGFRIFFLGGKEDAAEIAAGRLTRRYPGLKIEGIYSPPRGFERSREANRLVLEEINEVRPDILFVGLGTPKQEKWIYHNRHLYRAGVSFPVGAAFDFVSGKYRRAPRWMQQSGLEWFWRLLREPVRLSRRYLGRDLKFFPIIFRQKYHGRKQS